MRKFLISAAVAASALTAAAPAAAQWAPPAYGSPYGAPYGNAYGYNNHGQVRSLQVRVDNLQRQIRRLDQRNAISDREAARLMNDSRELERRLFRSARYGLSFQERQHLEHRLVRLEQRLWRDARDGNRYGYGNRDWNDRDGWHDRDRDGRNDRWEDDRGRDHDDHD